MYRIGLKQRATTIHRAQHSSVACLRGDDPQDQIAGLVTLSTDRGCFGTTSGQTSLPCSSKSFGKRRSAACCPVGAGLSRTAGAKML